MGLQDKFLEFGGPDLVPFLRSAGREPVQEVRTISAVTSATSPIGYATSHISSNQAKYCALLARYYVTKWQHGLAAHVLLRLAERQSVDGCDVPTLEKRHQYLINAVLQAKNSNTKLAGSSHGILEDGLLDLAEGKLAVHWFQIKIKEALEAMASNFEASSETSKSMTPDGSNAADANYLHSIQEK